MCEVPLTGVKRPGDGASTSQSKRRKEHEEATEEKCGGSVSTKGENDEFYDSSWLYTECSYCNLHMKGLQEALFLREKVVLQMHAQYSVFSKSSRSDNDSKEHVKLFKDEFLQKICALRNERGGVLIVHVTGRPAEKGPCLDDFDQKVGEELSRMIEDDTLYVENYDRRWYVPKSGGPAHLEFLILNIKGSSSVSTKDFNTLVTLDGSRERPKAREISRLLWRMEMKSCVPKDSNRYSFVEGKSIHLYESRDVQLKRLHDKDLEKDLTEHGFLKDKSLAQRIVWRLKKLHLLEYITSFTKLRAGGSFYCGIEEEKISPVVLEKPKNSKKKKKKKKGQGQKTEFDEETDEAYSTSQLSSQMSNQHLALVKNPGGTPEAHNCKNGHNTVLGADIDHKVVIGSGLGNQRSHASSEFSESCKTYQNSQMCSSMFNSSHIHNKQFEGQGSLERSKHLSSVEKVDPTAVGHASEGAVDPSLSGKGDYKTAHNIVRGYRLEDEVRKDLEKEIVSCMQKETLWLGKDGSRLSDDEVADEIEVLFHRTSAEQKRYVLEVVVKQGFVGLVFYKRYGPDAFKLDGVREKRPRVVRMDPVTWIGLIKKAMQCDNCNNPIWKLQEDSDIPF